MAYLKVPQEKIEEIRQSVNIVHYISQYVNLKKTGKNVTGLCPFHQEKTPSFVVNPEKQFYKCYGCGRGGNLYNFIMEYEKLTFPEALKKAADFAGIVLPRPQAADPQQVSLEQQLFSINETACRFFEKQLQKEENADWLAYFHKRKISDATIRLFRLGYAPDSYDALPALYGPELRERAAELGIIQKKRDGNGYYGKYRHRVIFPFFNTGGKIIGFGGRKLNEQQQPKYLNSPESPVYKKGNLLYGLHQAIEPIREKGYVFVVEGYFDLLRLVENGIRNVVAGSGTALTETQARILKRYTREVYMAYDGDKAGRVAAVRNARILENQELNVYILPMPEGEDPDTLLLNKGPSALRELIDKKMLPVLFRIQQFKREHPDPTLEIKDAFIHEFISDLASFNNTVKSGLYLHHLSEQLQVNESMLVAELNRLRRLYFRQMKMRREAPAAHADTASTTETPAEHKAPAESMKRGIHRAEEGLIRLLLNGEDALRKHIFEETGSDLFENEIYRRLYERILEYFEEEGRIDIHHLYESAENDEAFRQTLAALTVDTELIETRYADDCIFQLKKWQLESRARELSEQLRHERESVEAQMHFTLELNEIRRTIAALEKAWRAKRNPAS